LAKRAARAAVERANRANREKRWADAIGDYRRYLAWNPANFAVWVQLGHMLGETGEHNAAESAYAQADTLCRDDADLLLCWGHLRRRMGDDDAARDLYARSLAIDGNKDAAGALADLAPPQRELVDEEIAEPVHEPAAPDVEKAEPVFAGLVDHVDDRTIGGWGLIPEGIYEEDIQLWIGDRCVGHSPMIHHRHEQGYVFRTMIDFEGEVEVHVRRRSDGAELEGSPVTMRRSEQAVPAAVAWSVPLDVLKPFAFAGGEAALLVTHSSTGIVKPQILPYVRALKAQGVAVLLIAVVDRPLDVSQELLDHVDGALVRANRGYDFAAWAHALRLHPELFGATTLYLLNDSVFGPSSDAAFSALIERIRSSEAALVGLTESREWDWHLQSYFLALRQDLLASQQLQAFFADVRVLDDKDAIIRAYEVPLARLVRDIGSSIDVLFRVPIAINPTLFAWQRLIENGMPFVKVLLLRGQFPEADLRAWRDILTTAGFDMGLLDLTIRAASEHLPQGHAPGLIVRRPKSVAVPGDRPLRVALFGPWNYDSGLAAASRGLVAALRRTGVQLNLHPIRKPFHVHRPFSPPVDLLGFEGPADVAIVHLNPDSWHLLTEDQRALIAAARRRIGYWVWEMGHIPSAWWQDFGSVDRIWAPSQYCSELFAAHATVPVDVIPHAVPVLPASRIAKTEVAAEFSFPPEARVILYVFDGASYLVRKNPAALVRAFAASGLGERGWKLVLKTKHLMDRPADGAAFRTLAESVADVILIDRPTAPDMFRAMLDACDIYASPHCSEGFGLTIAEAMAAGKPVVATDFSGSRDFLDAASGYPVKAHPWILEEDFQHYTIGGEWSRIDEPALAATLVQAADRVEAGDTEIGDAARTRIAEQLSFENVGSLITQSFRETLNEAAPAAIAPDRVDQFQPVHTRLAAGLPTDRADFGPTLRLLVLDRSGEFPDDASALPADMPTDRDHWIAIVPDDARLHPLLASILLEHARDRPDVAIFYGDDFAGDAEHALDQLRLKPAFDLTLLCAQDYVGAPLIVRASAFAALGGLRREARTAATLDLLLRAYARGMSIERIPEVLIGQPGPRVRATPEDHANVLAMQPMLAPYKIVTGRVPNSIILRRRFDGREPHVTLIVPTRRSLAGDGTSTHVERLLQGVTQTDWPQDRLMVLIGDDVGEEPSWAQRQWPFELRRIVTERATGEPFSYSAKMNRLWRKAGSEHLVLLNDDVQPLDGGWLKALMTFAVDEGVGGVSARLLYENGSLQHAGMIPHGTTVAHAWLARRVEAGSYQDWADVQREWSMVTGAVFATRASVLREVNGFDEIFTVEYNDVDLALRIRALGYRIVQNPDAEMIHVEKASRGHAVPAGDQLARFLKRWCSWLDADPAWHPKLRRDLIDLTPSTEADAWYRS